MNQTNTIDSALELAMNTLSLPNILMSHRLILPGDEHALMPEEIGAFSGSAVIVRRASGAARIAARELLTRLGHNGCALPKASSGVAIWPAGIVGSLSHDCRVAIAAAAARRDIVGLGIDVEPAESLPADLLGIVTTPQERRRIRKDPYRGRLLFAAKEAVYKAVYPLDQTFLEHHDIHIDLADCKAIVSNGRAVELRFCAASHIVALAFVPAPTKPS